MKDKINIAELLRNCPEGMELDCTMYDNVVLEFVANVKEDTYPIKLKTKKGTPISVTEYGCYDMCADAKCLIYPKGKTTWEGFVPPCQFKDGDIVTCKDGGLLVACIYKERKNTESFNHYIALYKGCLGVLVNGEIALTDDKLRFAIEEEKAKLFKAIKYKGCKWNEETKTLEKLPKFKVGDTITNGKASITISHIDNEYYYETGRNFATKLPIKNQDEWELISEKFPNKFNINTLVPFESRVLVRNDEGQYWIPAFWGCKRADGYTTTFGWCKYCVPFEGNEHLLETNNDCNEYYKTWK